jgi:hypothetical protein
VDFFGHAWLAAEERPDAAFVFGAMLPDLASMAGLRVRAVDDGVAEAGWRFHHASDAAFHRCRSFAALCVGSASALRAAGVRRGPARAVGHVGVELLLDGWLAAAHGVPALYGEALALGPALAPALAFAEAADAAPLLDVCRRIAAAPGAPDAWCAPARLTERLVRILARRAPLALDPAELPAVSAWAAGARDGVAAAAPALLDELREQLSGARVALPSPAFREGPCGSTAR